MRSRSASVIAAHKDAPGSIAATKAAAQVAVPETQTTSRSDWLDGYRDELVRGNAAIRAIDLQRLIKELGKRGIAEKDAAGEAGRRNEFASDAPSDRRRNARSRPGKAHVELSKLPPHSAQVCISPPYWPARR